MRIRDDDGGFVVVPVAGSPAFGGIAIRGAIAAVITRAASPLTTPDGAPSMPVEFRCTSCRRRLRAPSRWAGNAIDCPRCAAKIVVPQRAGVSDGGVFESRSFERSLRDLEPSRPGAVASGAGDATGPLEEGLFDVDPLASIMGLPDSLPADSPGQSASPRRRRGGALGVYAAVGLAAVASGVVVVAYWLFRR